MSKYNRVVLSALMLTVASVSFSKVMAADGDENGIALDAPAPADANTPAPYPGGDDVGSAPPAASLSNSENADDPNKEAEDCAAQGAGCEIKLPQTAAAEPAEAVPADVDAAPPAHEASSENTSQPLDSAYEQMHSNLLETHPDEAQKLEKAYHASQDKGAVLAKWSKTAIASQDMLDTVDELHAIYQVLSDVDIESARAFEKKVQDEQDPRGLLKYAHQLLLKSLKDRKDQIEVAKKELTNVALILQYVDGEKAEEVQQIERTVEDPRTQMNESYDVLLAALESAHKEAGIPPLQ